MNFASELQIWEQIDVAESRYTMDRKYEEAASLASDIIQTIPNSNFETPVDDIDLASMMNSAGMLIVQSYEQLGRIRQVFIELKKIYGSIWAIPVEVFLTGANLLVKDGFKLELREILEEYLSKWEYMIDAGVYALREDETNKLSSNTLENDHKRRYFLSCEFYLEVAAVYTVKLLARSFCNIELAISWVDSADLPQDGREALLKKLQKLAKKQRRAAQRAAARVSTASSNEDSVETENEQSTASKGDKERKDFSRKLVQQSIQRGSDRLDTFLWWFRSIKIKIGGLQFVIPSGKLMLLFSLFFWMSFLLRKRGDVFRSLAKSKINSLKQAAFDALRLAFSVQMNPLAAVQQVPALPRASW
ncbi:3-phosphoinositide-dependent protein kinase-1-like [Rhynchospora pubera]|uniref:3-phosphoinositide-dependent protein kinase-1-like n=1 Tax=Rhynchospora pubera TaxID=906938 RepID=A0AAV8HMU2_9POAL|nr:3-phosphoinositide-dependent protein kinase-1-like [Rhynchospora pubera]